MRADPPAKAAVTLAPQAFSPYTPPVEQAERAGWHEDEQGRKPPALIVFVIDRRGRQTNPRPAETTAWPENIVDKELNTYVR